MRTGFLWLAGCVGGILVIAFFTTGGADSFQRAAGWISNRAQSAAVFFVRSISIAQIQNDYRGAQSATQEIHTILPSPETGYSSNGKVRILIVPGHQPQDGGTDLNGVYERDVVVDMADALAALLRQNPHYDVMVARTKTEWNPLLQDYFETHAEDIEAFRQVQRLQMESHLANGAIVPESDQIYHITAPAPAATQLYGINKWASENRYDITLHLHLNDYPGRRGSAGEYDGFAVYVPNHQYSNAEVSKSLGESIATRLSAYHATSTLPKENAGVVEDQELIAIGSNNTADGAALLIEYGYIHEPQFQNDSVRPSAVADYAYETYLGLQDFFKDPPLKTFGTASLPHNWDIAPMSEGESGPGVYALQAALHYLGYYPSVGSSFSDCPVSGKFGPCTYSAVYAYQGARRLPATGTVDSGTLAALSDDLSAGQ